MHARVSHAPNWVEALGLSTKCYPAEAVVAAITILDADLDGERARNTTLTEEITNHKQREATWTYAIRRAALHPPPFPSPQPAETVGQGCAQCGEFVACLVNAPCGHQTSCVPCVLNRRPTECPYCRVTLTDILCIYKM